MTFGGLEPPAWRAREREPITGVWGRSPQRGSRGRAPGGRSGGEAPLKLTVLLRLDVHRSPVIVRFIRARCES